MCGSHCHRIDPTYRFTEFVNPMLNWSGTRHLQPMDNGNRFRVVRNVFVLPIINHTILLILLWRNYLFCDNSLPFMGFGVLVDNCIWYLRSGWKLHMSPTIGVSSLNPIFPGLISVLSTLQQFLPLFPMIVSRLRCLSPYLIWTHASHRQRPIHTMESNLPIPSFVIQTSPNNQTCIWIIEIYSSLSIHCGWQNNCLSMCLAPRLPRSSRSPSLRCLQQRAFCISRSLFHPRFDSWLPRFSPPWFEIRDQYYPAHIPHLYSPLMLYTHPTRPSDF